MKYEQIPLAVLVKPESEPIYSELATAVTMVDEAAGPFVEVSQHGRTDLGKIAISSAEWPTLRAAIDAMLAVCDQVDESRNGGAR